MSAQSHAQTQRTVRSIASAMAEHRYDSPTADDLAVITGLPRADIIAHGEAARALAAASGLRQLRVRVAAGRSL